MADEVKTVETKVAFPENLQGMIDEAVAKAIRDKALDQVARKAGLFGGETVAPEYTKQQLAKAYVAGLLFQTKKLPLSPIMVKALSEGTTTAGGYLVRDDYRAELVMRIPELSELYQYVRQLPVGSDAGTMPSLATDVTITWGRSENAAITETDAVFGQVTWTITNMSAITFLSRELVSDANPRIVDIVTQLFQEAIAAERDKKIAIGTGSSQPEGLFSASGISAISGCSGELTYNKLVALKFGLARKYHAGSRWVMNETCLQWVHQLHDTNDRPILTDALINGDVPRILGYPFSTQKDIGSGQILFGNLSKYIWFDRETMEIETTTEGGDTFSKHQLGIKVVERCDGRVALGEALKKSGTFTVPT